MLVAPVATKPQIARAGYWILWQRWRNIGLLIGVGEHQEIFQFSGIESCQFEVEIGRGEILQFQGEKLVIEVCPRRRRGTSDWGV